jgi:hypothetical protein
MHVDAECSDLATSSSLEVGARSLGGAGREDWSKAK